MTRDVVSMYRVFIEPLRWIFHWPNENIFSRVIETLRALLELNKRKGLNRNHFALALKIAINCNKNVKTLTFKT